MDYTAEAFLAAIIVIILLIIVAFLWYNLVGWQSFSYNTGDSPNWLSTSDVSKLRFKDCIFTVNRSDGARTQDVTAVLNGMAVAYKGGTNNPLYLTLVRPLNPFSFVITGYNDSASVTDPSAAPWCTSAPPTCTTDGDCPITTKGSCLPTSSSGTCITQCASDNDCPGSTKGSCILASSGGSCATPCSSGQVCINGTCYTSGTCAQPCAAGQMCSNGSCVTQTSTCSTCVGTTVTLTGKYKTL